MQRLLVFFFTISTISTSACLCERPTLTEALNEADQVFIGTVLRRTHSDSNRVYFLVAVTRMFKGNHVDSLTIGTGFGGGDCGVRFEEGKSYLIFSHKQQTNRCDGTDLEEEHIFLEKLRYLFEKGYAQNFGQTIDPIVIDNEAAYLIIDKKQYFSNWGGKDVENSLLVLTEKEKMESGGFDAVVVSWSKIKISNRSRRRLLAKLKASLQ